MRVYGNGGAVGSGGGGGATGGGGGGGTYQECGAKSAAARVDATTRSDAGRAFEAPGASSASSCACAGKRLCSS